MASQKTKFTVGLFIFLGATIAVIAFIWLGMSRFLEKGQYYAIYFNESVQGLDIDSPVKYRGVTIGRVVRIEVAPDNKLILVVVQIDEGQTWESNIVAQLSLVGITGSMFIELDQKKEDEPDKNPVLNFPSDYPIIVSKPSSTTEILEGIDDFLEQIKAIDLGGISERIMVSLDNLNSAISDANIKGLSKNLESSLADIGRIVERERWDRILTSVEDAMELLKSLSAKANSSMDKFDRSLDGLEKITTGNEKTITEAIDDFREAMEKVNNLLDTGNSMITGADDTIYQLGENLDDIAKNIERATENINRITDIVTDQPSQLLFGEPRAPKKIEE
ncbi:MAG: MCE family protein [Deltaproteobacteria bacterium]|nr:MCE family protein [Deltaproteobacteria bacterium]